MEKTQQIKTKKALHNCSAFIRKKSMSVINYTTTASVDDFIVELIIDIVSGSDSPEKKASKIS